MMALLLNIVVSISGYNRRLYEKIYFKIVWQNIHMSDCVITGIPIKQNLIKRFVDKNSCLAIISKAVVIISHSFLVWTFMKKITY